jgi:hypothetical protein
VTVQSHVCTYCFDQVLDTSGWPGHLEGEQYIIVCVTFYGKMVHGALKQLRCIWSQLRSGTIRAGRGLAILIPSCNNPIEATCMPQHAGIVAELASRRSHRPQLAVVTCLT